MSHIDFRDDVLRGPELLNFSWRAKVASNAVDFTTRVHITIPDLDAKLKLGPCRWNPRDAVSLPLKGNDCLVIFDNDYEPWIVMWWPFA